MMVTVMLMNEWQRQRQFTVAIYRRVMLAREKGDPRFNSIKTSDQVARHETQYFQAPREKENPFSLLQVSIETNFVCEFVKKYHSNKIGFLFLLQLSATRQSKRTAQRKQLYGTVLLNK